MLYNEWIYSHNKGAIEIMSKRFTDTELWEEDWFIELHNDHKLFWFYLKDACNHAGIWRVNKKQFEFITGIKINLEKFLEIINSGKDRVQKINVEKWFIVEFVKFQNGSILNENNNAHKGILNELNNYKLDTSSFEVKEGSNTGQRGGSLTPIVRVRVKERKEIGGVGEKEKQNDAFSFEKFWDLYDKKVDRKNTEKKYANVSEADRQKIFSHIPKYKLSTPDPKYRKNPDTYLNNESWNDQISIQAKSNTSEPGVSGYATFAEAKAAGAYCDIDIQEILRKEREYDEKIHRGL